MNKKNDSALLNKNKKNPFLPFIMICWMAIIYYLSNQPGLAVTPFLNKLLGILPKMPNKLLSNEFEYVVRKMAHIIEYAILYMITFFAIYNNKGKNKEKAIAKAILASLLICLLFAISDEAHQYFVPKRDGRIFDVITDLFGVFWGQILVLIYLLIH